MSLPRFIACCVLGYFASATGITAALLMMARRRAVRLDEGHWLGALLVAFLWPAALLTALLLPPRDE